MNTIYIIWLREIKRYSRSRSRIIGSLSVPLLLLIVFGYGFAPIFQKAGEGNYLEFLAPGIIAMNILSTSISSGIELIYDRRFGLLKKILAAPISRLSIMIGKTLGIATVAIFEGSMILLISIAVGVRVTNLILLPIAFLIAALISILFSALANAIASFFDNMEGWQMIMNFFTMPMIFLSGAFFPLEGLPKTLMIIASLNPLTYGVDGLRGALINQIHFGFGVDFAILSIFAGLFLVLGSYLFSKIEI